MDNTDEALKLFVVLSKAYKTSMDLATKDMKQYGLTPSEFAILELLYHKGKTPLQRIGEKILLTSGSVTYTVDKLEKKGVLQRVPCPEDRRVIYAQLTPSGHELFSEIFPSHSKAIESIMSGLTLEEKKTAIALLKKLGTHRAPVTN